MIKRNWMLLALLAASIAVLFGYRFYDDWRTDSVAPEITVSDGGMLSISVADRDALLQGVTATDDRDGDVTASIIVEGVGNVNDDHQVTVTYAAFDSSGNVAKLQRTVQYTDYQSPRFTLSRSLDFVYGSSFDVLSCVGAQDILEGNISNRVKATSLSAQSINSEGIHEVQFRVTNSLGDTETLVLPVEVYYSGRYNAELALTDYLVYLPQGADFDAEDYLLQFIARGEATALDRSVPADLVLQMDDRVDTDVPGVYTVSYTITQTSEFDEYVGHARLIVVVEG